MSHTHFNIKTRFALEAYLDAEMSLLDISTTLGFNICSVKREIERNHATTEESKYSHILIPGQQGSVKYPKNKYRYSAELADYKARQRRYIANQSHHKLTGKDTHLVQYIVKHIKMHWSPEQIVGRLRTVGFMIGRVRYKIKLAVQTIYDFIYEEHKELAQYLRHYKRHQHTRSYYINKKKRETLQAQKGIDNRPKSVLKRKRIGHWEGDTVVGGMNGGTGRIATFTERKTGYLLAAKLDALTTKERALDEAEREVRRITTTLKFADGCVDQLKKYIMPAYRKTLTLDNGPENGGYEWIERGLTSMQVYFAHPYHSWERGTNENTNGLLRQYFPKGLDFRKVTQEDIDKAVEEINNRPRKRLNWRTPKEIMSRNHALRNLK